MLLSMKAEHLSIQLSELARHEFPELTVEKRSAISLPAACKIR